MAILPEVPQDRPFLALLPIGAILFLRNRKVAPTGRQHTSPSCLALIWYEALVMREILGRHSCGHPIAVSVPRSAQ